MPIWRKPRKLIINILNLNIQLKRLAEWKLNMGRIFRNDKKGKDDFEEHLKKEKITPQKLYRDILTNYCKEWRFFKSISKVNENFKVMEATPVCEDCFENLQDQMIYKYTDMIKEKEQKKK